MRLLSLACLCLSATAFAADPPHAKKIVLVAGPLDASHPAGTHEYEKTVRAFKYCLENAANVRNVRVEAHLKGWPEKPSTLDDADTIVFVSSGSDRKETDHPLLVGDRLAVVEKQMKRGCGLCLIHWSTFVPKEKAGDKILEWVGGYFDYQSGPAKNGWYSKIQTVTVKATPGRHPITAGIAPFEVKDEFYYNLRFRERDPRLVPVLTVPMKGEGEQTVAWAVERQDGGRGFGFTGGHFFDNWRNDNYRKLALNAILWTAQVPVPEEGVKSEFPKELGAAPKPVEKRLAFADGKFGKALDARVLPAHVEGDDRYRKPPLTVECWAKLFSKDRFNVLVSTDPKTSGQHWEIYTYAGRGDFSAYLPGTLQGEIRSGVDVCDGKWHHLAMSHDGKAVRLFVDGKNVKEQAVSYRPEAKPEPGPLVIGAAYSGDQHIGCDGLIDDVRISNVARTITAAPIAALTRDEHTLTLWSLDGDEGISADINWTPPTPTGAAEPWEKETDKDWVDARFSKTDTGPYLNATIDYEGPKGKVRSYKATAIKVGDKGEATVLFDRNQLRFAAAWTGGFLNHSSRRFGLLNTPTPNGEMVFTSRSVAGWADDKGNFESTHPATGPLPKEWARFKGLYLNGNRTVLAYRVGDADVLESPWAEMTGARVLFTRSIEVGKSDQTLTLILGELPFMGAVKKELRALGRVVVSTTHGSQQAFILLKTSITDPKVEVDFSNGRVTLRLPPSKSVRKLDVSLGLDRAKDRRGFPDIPVGRLDSPSDFTKPGPGRWTKSVSTQLEPGRDTGGPFVLDTFHLPHENPWNALFFVTGVDFLPDGRIAICTAHGDVWTAKEIGNKVEWKRFATGLYQPLGLKVVDGMIVVTERGQLTRLHDLNNDGEADFYENLNNDWHTGGGEHSYDTCLETDPGGNFYLFKTGDDHTPTGGCLLKISKDGSKSEIFATGFRHPIGLGVSPDGKIISGADQEGNWMPATRLDFYKKGGFYGDMRTHHRSEPPKIYDEPYLWLPKEADNSAAGQVWVPKGSWGALGGHMLHLSYGRCKGYAILPDGDRFQGAAVDLGLTFLSGSARGRFNPKDGNLYVVGLRGWQTAAKKDGCLQRVRYTGKPFPFPVGFAVEPDGVRLAFDQAIDPASVADLSKFKVGRWNYRWSADYGSKNWSVVDPKKEGIDKVEVVAATLSDDRRSVKLRFADMRVAMQTKIEYDVRSAAGAKLAGAVYTTIREWK